MQTVTIFATMRPDTEGGPCTVLVERTSDFGAFVALVLGFRKDPDCVRLVWIVEPALPAPPPPTAGRPAPTILSACE